MERENFFVTKKKEGIKRINNKVTKQKQITVDLLFFKYLRCSF